MNFLIYLLQTIAYSGVLWLVYSATFRRNAFHRGSRIFLLIASILPLILPFVRMDINSRQPEWLVKIQLTEIFVNSSSLSQTASVSSTLNWLWPYAAVAFALAVFYTIEYGKIFFKIQGSKRFERMNGIEVRTETGIGPGSFWKTIFFPEQEIDATIFFHEAAHIKCLHRYDLVFLQLLTIAFWANPFSWLFLREIKMVHEFEADEIALANTNLEHYSELLLSKSFGAPISVAHSFFHHSLKRRIIMLQQKSNRKNKIGSVALAALLALSFSSTVLYAQQKEEVKNTPSENNQAEPIFKFVEKMPKFNGDLSAFLTSKLHYPDSARAHNEEGRSIVQFIVNEKGAVVNPIVVRSSGFFLLDDEALRVVNLMPHWIPGEQKGEKVAVYYTLPITFKLDN